MKHFAFLAVLVLPCLAQPAPLEKTSQRASFIDSLRQKGRRPTAARVRNAGSCPIQDIALPVNLQGSLTAADCKLVDYVGNSHEQGAPQADAYSFTVRSRTVVTIRMTSPHVNSYLYLLDAEFFRVTRNDNGRIGEDSEIVIGLEPGTYVILATSALAATGDYQLSVSGDPPRTCVIADLRLGQDLTANFSDSDCRTADLSTMVSGNHFIKRYKLTLAEGGILVVGMTSPSLDSVVLLSNEDGQAWQDDNTAGNRNARLTVSLNPGTYLVDAVSKGGAAGAYVLTANLEPRRQCTPAVLEFDTQVSGNLEESDCRYIDLFSEIDFTDSVDIYGVDLRESAILRVQMTSGGFDTLLELYDSDFGFMASNDDVATGNTNSEMVSSVPPGRYHVAATSYDGASGSYRLTARREPLRRCTETILSTSATAEGALSLDDCRVFDFIVPSDVPIEADVYRLSVASLGVLTIAATSSAFTPVIVILDSKKEVLFASGDVSSPAVAETLIPPGEYYVVIVAGQDSLGGYQLKTSMREPVPCEMPPFVLNSSVEGALTLRDCKLREVIPFISSNNRADIYRMEVREQTNVNFHLASRDLVFLGMSKSTYEPAPLRILSFNADGCGYSATLDPGSYLVYVMEGDGGGTYTLSNTAEAAPAQ